MPIRVWHGAESHCKSCHTELTQGGYLARFTRVMEFRRFQALVADTRRQDSKTRIDLLARSQKPVSKP